MFDVTTIGEIMLRLSVPAGERLEMADTLQVHPAGAESNVAAALSRLARRAALITALPESPLGRIASNRLRGYGINLDGVVWRESGRMGTYYVEYAHPPRPVQVVYDRADSCISRMTAADLDWGFLLDTRLVYISGITPALSESCRDMTQTIIERARDAGVAVSFDVNYRQKLWTPGEAAAVLAPLMQGVDLLFCKRADALNLFGCTGEPEAVIAQLAERTHAKHIVVTLGAEGVIGWDGDTIHRAQAVPTVIVDRLGAGDAMAAGVIHGWLDGDFPVGLRYGAMLAALALSQHGDMLVTTPAEVHALLAQSAADGGVVR